MQSVKCQIAVDGLSTTDQEVLF